MVRSDRNYPVASAFPGPLPHCCRSNTFTPSFASCIAARIPRSGNANGCDPGALTSKCFLKGPAYRDDGYLLSIYVSAIPQCTRCRRDRARFLQTIDLANQTKRNGDRFDAGASMAFEFELRLKVRSLTGSTIYLVHMFANESVTRLYELIDKAMQTSGHRGYKVVLSG